jgi:hypothetical protein
MAENRKKDQVIFPFLDNEEGDTEVYSDIFYCPGFRDFSFQTFGASGAATVEVEVSLEPENPTHWFKAVDAIALNGFDQFQGIVTWMRFKRDASTDPLTVICRRGLQEGDSWS